MGLIKKSTAHPLEDSALETFVEKHHRAPSDLELKNLEKTLERGIDKYIEERKNVLGIATKEIFERLPLKLTPPDWEQTEKELATAFELIRTTPLIFEQKEDDQATLQSKLKLSNVTMQNIYNLAFDLFNESKFYEAQSLFDLLTFLNPMIKEYQLALGHSLKAQNLYQEALVPFAMVYFLDEAPIDARAQSIDCYIKLQQYDDAKLEMDEFEKLIPNSNDPPFWLSIFEQFKHQLNQ